MVVRGGFLECGFLEVGVMEKRNSFANIVASGVTVCLAVVVGTLPFSFFTKIIYPIIGIINFLIFVFL